ncbi:MAG: phosphoribosylformylglycinamidine synthase subunit PurQ [Planctomycetaceae bacterium]|nr:phosphoribosylformylglycinamidine synthase subunit PurQ [Planctomycetaceae bacterium]
MAQPRVLVLRAPGTNCDLETAYAFELAGAKTERLHINRLLEKPAAFAEFQILCLPGGFSFGDDLGAGRILGSMMRSHLADALREFKAAGKLILGICNGFQILVKSGILVDDDPATGLPPVTLTWNDSGRYQDRWVKLRTSSSKCVFFAGIESMYLPIAHAEGKFVPRDGGVLSQLDAAGQLALRYDGNPNGAIADVAGVCDSTGLVCGLMPHPERHVDTTQHPRWTRGESGPVGDGLKIFQNAVAYWN